MRIVVASGKGGTGKTTVAVNLAWTAARAGHEIALLDCDVEEPNCHIFLQPEIGRKEECTVPVPAVEEERCTGCGVCQEVCEFNAIVTLGDSVMVFPELCHGCGACTLMCPEHALHETPKVIGEVETGTAHGLGIVQGRLNIGEVLAPALIRQVKKAADSGVHQIIDAPPGTTCPVVETVKCADYVVLVTEPTPFGLNDLKLAVDMMRKVGCPFGVVVNRDGIGNRDVYEYCGVEDIPVLAAIPDDSDIAKVYSRGLVVSMTLPRYRDLFLDTYDAILTHKEEVQSSTGNGVES